METTSARRKARSSAARATPSTQRPGPPDTWAIEQLGEATSCRSGSRERREGPRGLGHRFPSHPRGGNRPLRYAEDEVERAAERGVDQYVILGAGFDTFALRRNDLADRIRVFEVD